MRVLLYGMVLGAGFLLAALTGRLVWAAYAAQREAPAAPLQTAVAAAPEGRWVRLTDLSVRCDTRVESRGSTFFLAEGGPAKEPVVLHLLGAEPCPAESPEGGFLPGRYTRAWLKEKFDVTFPGEAAEGADARLFTTTLTPAYQQKAMLRLLPMLALGVLMGYVGVRGLLRARRAGRSGAGPRAG
jgi:hypothetical protein